MRITNIEKFREDVNTTITETFADTRSNMEYIITAKGLRIKEPVVVLKSGKDFAVVEVLEDGSIVIWDENYELHTIRDSRHYKNKMIMVCDLVRNIMMMDKYCTLY